MESWDASPPVSPPSRTSGNRVPSCFITWSAAEQDGNPETFALVPVIASAWFWLYVPPWQKALVVTLLFAFFMRKRLRAALNRHDGESAT